ncbi:hypothetical protein [Streptomyces blattellae]|uniref:hypothetical protein n=1 Tax=Streptomyces blattellae TaxID=2569855 RepID=UPI0012B70D6A|nr:hypothetical protein [Streptomyces blattellae]
MAAGSGRTRGGAAFGRAAVLAVLAGGAGAVLVPVHGAPVGGLWLLVGWVVLAAAAGWCAETAIARSRPNRWATDQSESRTLHLDTIGILAIVLVAELTLIIARLARGHEYPTAWAAGGLLLALFVAASWRNHVISGDYSSAWGHTPSENPIATTGFVLTEASGGWLTARFAVEGPVWATWAVGCVMVALAGGFLLSDSQSPSAEDTNLTVFRSAAALGAAGVIADFAVRGEYAAAWWAGGGLLLLAAVVFLGPVLRQPRVGGGRGLGAGEGPGSWVGGGRGSWVGGGRGRMASPGAQFAGILVPLASLAWAVWDQARWSGQGADGRLPEAGWLAVAAAVLLVVQNGVLIWAGTVPSERWVDELVYQTRRLAYEAANRPSRPYPAHDPHDPYERAQRREWEPELTFLQRLARPLLSSAATAVHRRTVLDTGLAIDEIWPRIELVTPDQVRRQLERGERGVLGWRITIASAVCTAGAWLFVALTGLGGFRLSDASIAPLVVGPLLVAAVALMQGRKLLVQVSKAKADAVEIYRYDLAKRLHLSVDRDRSDPAMILLAAELSGRPLHPSERRPPTESPTESPTGLLRRSELETLTADVAERVRRDVRTEVRQALREEEYRSLAEPISTRLKDHLTDLQRTFHQEIRAAIRSTLEDSMTGPPLTNFAGYLAIEVDRSEQDGELPSVRTEGGTIKASAGRRVELSVVVVRGERSPVVASPPGGDFFVSEPVRVEGGRDAPVVSFDALVDSSTLTPLPQRRNLLVEDEQRTSFAFRLPEEDSSHEVWIQLYQAGHLVQVVALKIEAAAVLPGGTSDEAAGATDDV